jgi:thymidylate synthase
MAELIKIVKTIIDSKPTEENQIILPIETINGMPVIAKITITRKQDIDDYTTDDFVMTEYNYHEHITLTMIS